jgi:hypothetical protein
MGAAHSSKMLVAIYQTKRSHTAEDSNLTTRNGQVKDKTTWIGFMYGLLWGQEKWRHVANAVNKEKLATAREVTYMEKALFVIWQCPTMVKSSTGGDDDMN